MQKWKTLVLGLFMACPLSACSNVNKEQQGIGMIDFNNPKTVCIGRLEVTVPKETDVKYGSLNFNGSDIYKNGENELDNPIKTYAQYQAFIKNRVNFYAHELHETERVLLKQHLPGPADSTGRVNSDIIVFRGTQYTKDSFEIYGYIFINNNMYVLKAGSGNDKVELGINDMRHNLASISSLPTDQRYIDKLPAGICWNGLFIADDMTTNRHFDTTIVFTFPSYPQVRARINNAGRYESDAPLIQMIKANEAAPPLIYKTLVHSQEIHIGDKTINGLDGEEYSSHIDLRKPFQRGYESMIWQHLGELNNPKNRLIKFNLSNSNEMDNEGFGDALVSQKKVTQLAYFILNSIKISKNNQIGSEVKHGQ